MHTIRNQEMGHFIKEKKWANGKNQRTNYIYYQEKPKMKPPLNIKENIRLRKKNNQWCQIKKK
jgi:hypothetical protein